MALKPYDIEPDNLPMRYAYELISKTRTSFFLTGKAGTGKTTFISHVLRTVNKAFVVLAPTGVSAMNAGGRTIHSFFGLHPAVIGPRDIAHVPEYGRDRILGNGWKRIRPADTIIIDEVSMVRSDVLDAVDRALRVMKHSAAPFGGLQMVFVGDLYQLEPVVTEFDRPILEENYGTGDYHFFSSWALDSDTLPKIELTKVYRQSDMGFVNLLDRIRTGRADEFDIETLNRTSGDLYCDDDTELRMYLSAYRRDADRINEDMMSSLPGSPVTYDAIYKGDCSSWEDVIEPKVTLKVGAQVVFIKNDEGGLWANGTLGVVSGLKTKTVSVILETGEEVSVERETWEATDLTYDWSKRRTVAVVKGYVKQMPLKAAWAVTIHKSQSMTYSRAIVDMGRGAFSAGQVYVALSRVRGLGGLTLVKPITRSSVMVDPNVVRFSGGVNNWEQVALELSVSEATEDLIFQGLFAEASDALFNIFLKAVERNDRYQAETLLERYLLSVIDDRAALCEPGLWKGDSGLVAAALSLYSGDPAKALEILDDEGNDDLDRMYLRMRCHEELSDEDALGDSLDELLFECEQDIDHGAPTIRHRKVLLSALLHPDLVTRKALASAINALLDDIRMYDGLYLEIIRCVRHVPEFRDLFSGSENVLGVAMAGGEPDEDIVYDMALRYRNYDPWLECIPPYDDDPEEIKQRWKDTVGVWEEFLNLMLRLEQL